MVTVKLGEQLGKRHGAFPRGAVKARVFNERAFGRTAAKTN